jgi:putative transposase
MSGEVRRLLSDGGIRVVADAVAGAQCECHAERFVRSIKHECLDRVIPLGERHFRQIVSEYVAHHHHERNHQGLGNTLIDGIVSNRRQGLIRRRSRLGGLLNYYERAA